MRHLSRRSLARWAANQITSGTDEKAIVDQLAATLIASRRENQADMLARDVAYELERSGQLGTATITTRYPLSADMRSVLQRQIAQATATKSMQLDEKIDPTVIGGVRIATATRSWDFTVRSQLNELRKVL